MSTVVSQANIEEVAYMLILNADISARNRKRLGGAVVTLGLDEPVDDPREELVLKVQRLRLMIGDDAPIFPEPWIIGQASESQEMFGQCYETAYQLAKVEMGEVRT